MKKLAYAVLIITITIFLINPLYSEARGSDGGGHGGGYYRGGHGGGYYRGGHGGGYYRGGHGGGYWDWWWPWAVFGWAAALAPYYAPYYYEPPPVVIQEQPPVYVQPAPSVLTPLSAEKIFVYPRKGQSEEQQAKDRNECHTWAVKQTHYDPTQSNSGMPEAQLNQMYAKYLRAMDACLDGRGYTMK